MKWKLRKQLAKLIKGFPIEKLPQYLELSDCFIRKKARERFNELIEQLSLEALPKYLTNCNQFIREKATEHYDQLLENSTKMIPECLQKYDYRENIIIDKDNPILIWKAWRDRYSDKKHWKAGYGGKAYLSSPNGEDALTWNVFRSLQMVGKTGLDIISEVFGISKVNTILFWGCDVENHGEKQQLLNILIRTIDGKYKGTMTEPDLVIITKCEVVFVECKLNLSGDTSPWKAPDKKDKTKIDGADKRFGIYKEMFPELMCINDWRNVYQLIRQYVYARSLGSQLSKQPLVIPLINENHKEKLFCHYLKIKDCIANYNNVFREFVTWQEIDKIITGVESNLTNSDKEKISGISTKIKYTLAHVRK
jgi:hypothetical protein